MGETFEFLVISISAFHELWFGLGSIACMWVGGIAMASHGGVDADDDEGDEGLPFFDIVLCLLIIYMTSIDMVDVMGTNWLWVWLGWWIPRGRWLLLITIYPELPYLHHLPSAVPAHTRLTSSTAQLCCAVLEATSAVLEAAAFVIASPVLAPW
jgi:hypothetical protein